jgi:alcohol dehydrogenase class IV
MSTAETRGEQATLRARDPLRLVRYELPTVVIYGAGSLESLPGLLDEAGMAYPLLLTDRGLARTPIPGEVSGVLDQAGISACGVRRGGT